MYKMQSVAIALTIQQAPVYVKTYTPKMMLSNTVPCKCTLSIRGMYTIKVTVYRRGCGQTMIKPKKVRKDQSSRFNG